MAFERAEMSKDEGTLRRNLKFESGWASSFNILTAQVEENAMAQKFKDGNEQVFYAPQPYARQHYH